MYAETSPRRLFSFEHFIFTATVYLSSLRKSKRMVRSLKSCQGRNDLTKLGWLCLENKLRNIRIKFYLCSSQRNRNLKEGDIALVKEEVCKYKIDQKIQYVAQVVEAADY